jgi:amino acid adenylation domain-containing protein
MSRLLQDWVTFQAGARPGACAVVSREKRLTYGELETMSNQVARMLTDHGCVRGDRIALLMPKSPAAIVCILGINKADCIFVPLDPASPAARLTTVLQTCDSRCVLAAPSAAGLLDELHVEGLTSWTDRLTSYSGEALEYRNGDGDPAHILFTSGSTGAPKGVVITHANVIAFVEWARRHFGMRAGDRVSGHSPLHFDLSTFDVFGAFAAGAELHLVPPELNFLPHKLTEFIRRSELTQWFSVPSILNYLAKVDAIAEGDFPALERLLWCGEVFPTAALIYWMKRLPHVAFTNLYGPTETTIASASYTLRECPRAGTDDVPIGRACDGEEVLVLDEDLDAVPVGEIGELYIGGVGVSPGYWQDPERTAAVFLPHPRPSAPHDRVYKTGDLGRLGPDGEVYFVGRADTQIKSRGYRIELSEIEAALTTIDGLQESAVVGVPTAGFEGTIVACAYAPQPGRRVSPPDLRRMLGALVPPYMLPSRWLEVPALPKNASGKIDRRALRERFEARESLNG